MKNYIVLITTFFSFLLMGQDSNHKSSLNMGLNFNKPFFLNREAKDFFNSKMNLKDINSYGYGFYFESRSFGPYVLTGMNFSRYSLSNENKSMVSYLSMVNAYLSVGLGWDYKRFLFGSELQVSAMVGGQQLSKSIDLEDLHEGFEQDQYNSTILENQFMVNFGITPYIRYNLHKKFSVDIRYQYYLLDMKNLGQINNIPLYNNYSNLSIGIAFNLSKKSKKKQDEKVDE